MIVSNGMIKALELVEGSARSPYKDVAGLSTVGVGHLIMKKDVNLEKVLGSEVPSNFKLTDRQIEELLALDLVPYSNAVNKEVVVDLTQNEFDALVMFVFNVGVSAFKKSSLLKKVNAKATRKEISIEFMKWNKARVGGVLQPVQGLTNRREVERQIFNLGTPDQELYGKLNFRINDIRFVDTALNLYRGEV